MILIAQPSTSPSCKFKKITPAVQLENVLDASAGKQCN